MLLVACTPIFITTGKKLAEHGRTKSSELPQLKSTFEQVCFGESDRVIAAGKSIGQLSVILGLPCLLSGDFSFCLLDNTIAPAIAWLSLHGLGQRLQV